MLSIPIIHVDSEKARELDISIALHKIYYQSNSYQRTAKKLFEASLKAGFDFVENKVRYWLEKQTLFQIHKPQPRFIPRALFNSIQIPNECYQANILYMPYNTIRPIE